MISRDIIEKILERVRPYLQIDGGDVEFVEIVEPGIVKIRLLGACYTCPLNLMTLRAGIERIIMKEIPEVKRVEAVD